jgi:hypothetical protein
MKEIVDEFDDYIGGDIVDEAIVNNNKNYANDKVKFINFDLLSDNIPKADLLIVRDVIGHLPIEDGKDVINKILNSDCKFLLSTTWAKKNYNGWVKCEDGEVDRQNEGVEYGRFYPVNLMSEPFNLPEPEFFLEEDVVVDNFDKGLRKVLALWDLSKIKKKQYMKKTTIVTGLWDIGRQTLNEGWSRSYEHYLNKFNELLDLPNNMIIYGDSSLREIVFKKRKVENTQFINREISWFLKNDYYEKIQKIRTDPNWFNQVGWLKDSTQAKLDLYNPLVMSKMFLLHDAKILDNFDSDYLFWIDAGITNTVHPGYFTHDLVLDKASNLTDKFMFVCFPYETSTEIHGFKYREICEYAKNSVKKVTRGGFFGGTKDSVSEINSIYYGLLNDTLNQNLMGTEESIFTIINYLYSEKIDSFDINQDGLFGTFFEGLKTDKYLKKVQTFDPSFLMDKVLDITNETPVKLQEETALYVIGFNSPNQFKTLIHSMMFYDKNFIDKTKKYLLNNSTDLSTTEQYEAVCKSYGFEHVKKDNLGITGGRQWIADHFNESGHKYCMFFEDDMFFHSDRVGYCRNGFNRYVPNLYDKVLSIIKKENFDFLKFNFSEFFGDNGTQWSWYNVPQGVRVTEFPEKTKLPTHGLDPDAPRTNFKNIRSVDGLSYITGDIYYSNWPQIMSKEGNKKCFIDTRFQFPYEQTIMSFIFQETRKGNIKPGLLLLTPTEHNRFEHYDGSLRKEC